MPNTMIVVTVRWFTDSTIKSLSTDDIVHKAGDILNFFHADRMFHRVRIPFNLIRHLFQKRMTLLGKGKRNHRVSRSVRHKYRGFGIGDMALAFTGRGIRKIGR